MKKRKAKRTRRNPLTVMDQLESLVDAATLAKTVDALSGIAFLKAQHIEENWQDRGLARQWERGAKLLDATSNKLRKLGI